MDQGGNNSRNEKSGHRILFHKLEDLRNPRIRLKRGCRLRHDVKAEKNKAEAKEHLARKTENHPLGQPAHAKADGDEENAVIENLFYRDEENNKSGSDAGPQRDRHGKLEAQQAAGNQPHRHHRHGGRALIEQGDKNTGNQGPEAALGGPRHHIFKAVARKGLKPLMRGKKAKKEKGQTTDELKKV